MTRLGRAIAANVGAVLSIGLSATLAAAVVEPPRPAPPATVAPVPVAAHVARLPYSGLFCPVLGLLVASAPQPATDPNSGGSGGAGDAPAGNQSRPTANAEAPTVGDLRVTLARLLAAHAFLLLESMRASAQSAPDGPATLDALNSNTNDLTAAIGSVYGTAAGQSFEPLWQRHITDVLAYARAVVAHDTNAQQAAITDLQGYQKAFNDFITKANPQIDPNAEALALQMHITQMLTFASGDYNAAYGAERASFVHMFGFGDMLAQAIGRQYPTRFTGATALSPAALLRITLDRLLAEHAVLAAGAMRAKLTNSPDVSAVVDAMNGNGQDIVQAIGRVYGATVADAFQGAWNQHIQAYLAYIDAVKNNDEAARQQQIDSLNNIADQLAQVLASADPKLSASAVSAMLRAHSRALTDQVDAEAAADYPRAVATVDDAYAHMFTIGDALAAGIAAQFPDRFREIATVPPTTTAPSNPDSAPPHASLVIAALSAVAGLVALGYLLARRHVGA